MTWLALIAAGWLSVSQPQMVSGIVRDATGAGIAGASVVARMAGTSDRATRTDAQGHFTVTLPAGEITLIVSAVQFQSVVRQLRGTTDTPLEIVLVPAIEASVTVTAGRIEQALPNIAASVSIVDRS